MPICAPIPAFAFVADLQERVTQLPLTETLSFRGGRSGPGGDALDIQLYGASADGLKEAAEALKTALGRYPEVSALEDNLAYDKTELILDLTPQGASMGFTTDELGRLLRERSTASRPRPIPTVRARPRCGSSCPRAS